MNLIDLLLLLIVGFSIWTGWKKGFILGTLDLITWAGSIIAGFLLYTYAADGLRQVVPAMGVWTLPVAFILTVILARILISLVANRLLHLTPETTHLSPTNRLLGVVPGFINGLINAMIVAALLLALPLSDGISAATRNSGIANRFVVPAEWLESQLSPVFNDAIQRSMNKMTVEPKSNESVKLHFTVTHPRVREDLEAKMLELVNEERRKEGLQPLKADPEMAAVARAHSRDMFARGYFAHVNPDGEDPFDRMREMKVRFLTAGENLALAQTLTLAHKGLMNSPGHRANILQPSFGRLGIGILDGGLYGLMVTQNFRN